MALGLGEGALFLSCLCVNPAYLLLHTAGTFEKAQVNVNNLKVLKQYFLILHSSFIYMQMVLRRGNILLASIHSEVQCTEVQHTDPHGGNQNQHKLWRKITKKGIMVNNH